MDNTTDHHNWKFRRRYLMVVTAFTMALMGYSVVFRAENTVSETVVSMGFVGLIGYVGSYVFGAVWDHNNIRANSPSTSSSTYTETSTRGAQRRGRNWSENNAGSSPVADVSRDMDQA